MTELLVWMDLEMTGLDPERERIIELAIATRHYGNLNACVQRPCTTWNISRPRSTNVSLNLTRRSS